MERFERRAWIVMAAGAPLMGAALFTVNPPVAVATTVAMLILAYWMAPWRGGRSVRHDELGTLPPEKQRVVVYWRPGCLYCTRLRKALGAHRNRATWINIWQDDVAEEYVRSVNEGNATVPTVVIAGQASTNPEPEDLLPHLR